MVMSPVQSTGPIQRLIGRLNVTCCPRIGRALRMMENSVSDEVMSPEYASLLPGYASLFGERHDAILRTFGPVPVDHHAMTVDITELVGQ